MKLFGKYEKRKRKSRPIYEYSGFIWLKHNQPSSDPLTYKIPYNGYTYNGYGINNFTTIITEEGFKVPKDNIARFREQKTEVGRLTTEIKYIKRYFLGIPFTKTYRRTITSAYGKTTSSDWGEVWL